MREESGEVERGEVESARVGKVGQVGYHKKRHCEASRSQSALPGVHD